MQKLRVLCVSALLCLILVPDYARAGTVAGSIQLSNGAGVPNGTLSFTLSQPAVLSGTASLATQAVSCWSDKNGVIHGLPGDAALAAPVLSTGAGSLGAATYYFRYTWANAGGESEPSAERSVILGGSGSVILAAPTSVPPLATSMKVYIGASAGSETLQGSVAVTAGVLAGGFTQSTALVSGAALPTTNTSVCTVAFNDTLIPSFTNYLVNFVNVNGAKIPGFTQKWYLSGGLSGTVNVGSGLPLYSGVVVYPQPIVSIPGANALQSINGPLNLNGFALTAGSINVSTFNTGIFNGDIQANFYATGGAGTVGSPWTSASGTGGIGEAIVAAGTADGGNARIHITAGFYSITACINATANVSTAQGNSAPPTPLIIQGDSPGKTVLVGGTGGCVFDTTGRAVSIKELTIIAAVSTPSVLGILQGRATNAVSSFTPNNIFEHLVIDLGTVPAANGGHGTIGIYNYSSEGNWYHQNTITSDQGCGVLTSNNIFSIGSAYNTQNTTLRFVSENVFEGGSCAAAGLTAGQAILLQGHAANTKIIGVAGECNGGSPSPVFLRIKAPTAPDSASDPLAGLVLENSQAECVTGGQLIVNEQILSDAKIHGAFKNLVNIPVILLTTAASQLIDPIIDLQLGNGGISTPLISDGGVATGGILGGVIMLPATGTIAFTNAASACNGVHVYASYASPSITCNNAAGYGASGTLIGEMWATDQYYFKGTGANNYNSNSSHTFNVAGAASLFMSSGIIEAFHPLTPNAAGGQDLGVTSLPWGNLWLGTAATNNFKFQPAATAAAVAVTIADPGKASVGLPFTIGSGTASMTTAGISTGACGSTVTVGATGVLTTDTISFARNAAATIGNGGGLTLNVWPTAGNVNFNYCNSAAGTITPTATTINWTVVR